MHTETFQVRTQSRSEMQNIDSQLRYIVRESGIRNGLVTIYIPHTTAGVTINENADPDVIHDVLEALDRAVPWRQDFYQHGEGNSAAHVKSSMVGCSLSLPLVDSELPFGTWQSIFFCEFDGPRTRKVLVSITEG